MELNGDKDKRRPGVRGNLLRLKKKKKKILWYFEYK